MEKTSNDDNNTSKKTTTTTTTAKCPLCGVKENLIVWFGDDGYGFECMEAIRCQNCPKPESIWVDLKRKYNPNMDDKTFRLKDYNIPLSYVIRGKNDVMGLCFYCKEKFNGTKDGYGREYLPESLWKGRNDTKILFCCSCYTERRKNHFDLTKGFDLLSKEESVVFLEELERYFKDTNEGLYL